jgi:Ca2+-transporting ATPase
VITGWIALRMLVTGLLVTATAAIAFHIVYDGGEGNLERARTTVFCVLAYSQLFFSFACRSWKLTLPQLGVFSNPYLLGTIAVSALLQFSVVAIPLARPALGTAMHPPWEWVLVFALALTPVTAVELGKLAWSFGNPRRTQRS